MICHSKLEAANGRIVMPIVFLCLAVVAIAGNSILEAKK